MTLQPLYGPLWRADDSVEAAGVAGRAIGEGEGAAAGGSAGA